MKIKKPLLTLSVLIGALIITFVSCKKDLSSSSTPIPPGKAELKVMMTDDPSVIFDSIFINIQQLEVLVKDSTGAEKWDTLKIRAGVYNILNFRNGLDTLLGTGIVPNGSVEKIRVTLGATGNAVVLKGITIPITLANNNTQIVLNVDDDVDRLDHNHFRLFIDFDGIGSIRLHNGKLELNLHLTHFSHDNSGELEGKIKPSGAFPVSVTAIAGTDSLIAIPENEGEFKIRGIKTNTVDLLIKPSNGYKDSLIKNIPIQKGNDTKLATITLHK